MGLSYDFENSWPSNVLTKYRKNTIAFVIFLTLTILVLASFFTNSVGQKDEQSLVQPSVPTLHPVIKQACKSTLYPSICFTTLSSISTSKNYTNYHLILEIMINKTIESADTVLYNIKSHIPRQKLDTKQKNALRDCAEMLDQTLYELGQAIDDMRALKPRSFIRFPKLLGNIKTLLSAAMTNENTCLDGFSDLEEFDPEDNQKNLREHLQELLAPVSRMISNCLAMIKYLEKRSHQETLKHHRRSSSQIPKNEFPAWMTSVDRNLMDMGSNRTPDVIVARDGSGDYGTISEAVRMAPNKSMGRYVIKIKAGIYNETVIIPREKVNVMLVGDSMNSTVITSSKNIVDGFSTYASATLTIQGDKFLARDLTIINTSGPEKHQAVAARVTSNAAFYRCNFSSYQDTLYAHSLLQFYRDCAIEGTVDFIFGNAAAVFQNCLIVVRKPIPGQKNMITAQGREDPNQNTGISLQNCTIVAAPEFNFTQRQNFSTYLGRPWRNFSRTMVMKSYLGDLIHPKGWYKWNEYSTLDTVQYIEHQNFEPGSDTRHRVTWRGYSKNCSEDLVKQFTVEEFLHGADDWLESTGFPLFSGF